MKKILVVDDVALVREPIEAMLQQEGYEARGASSGSEALMMMEAQAPDLVLLDLSMPTMDGLRVLSILRRHPRLHSVPVVILSSEGERSRIREAAQLGISGYILKSRFSAPEFLQRIEKQFAVRTPDPQGRAPESIPGPAAAAAAPPKSDSGSGGATSTPGSAPERNAPAAHRPRAAKSDSFDEPLTALRSLAPIMRRGEVLERIESSSELKGLSPVVGQVLKLTRSAQCSTESIAKAISQDPAVALKVLQLANSAVYSRGDAVESMHKAVVRIGLERIRNTVMNVAVVDRFSATAFDECLSTPQFWEHSIGCGVIAAEIAQVTTRRTSDGAFTAGLVHDVGRLVLAEQLGEEYTRVIDAARDLGLPLEQVETRLLLVNHADVMDGLLHKWELPEAMINPILLHHLSPRGIHAAAPKEMFQTYGLALANRLAHAMLLGSSGNDTIYAVDDLCAALGIEAQTIAQIVAVAGQQTDDMRAGMVSQSSGDGWPRRSDQIRSDLHTSLRPIFISEQPGLDAFRVFCEALADPSADGPPNIAVVNTGRLVDPSPLFAMLERAEQEMSVENLPVLVLSQVGRAWSAPSLLHGRRCQYLSTPFVVGRFVAAVNEATARPSHRGLSVASSSRRDGA